MGRPILFSEESGAGGGEMRQGSFHSTSMAEVRITEHEGNSRFGRSI